MELVDEPRGCRVVDIVLQAADTEAFEAAKESLALDETTMPAHVTKTVAGAFQVKSWRVASTIVGDMHVILRGPETVQELTPGV